MEEALTVTEVAMRYKISAPTVRRLLDSGQLKGHKMTQGRTSRWRIAPEELRRFFLGQDTPAKPA